MNLTEVNNSNRCAWSCNCRPEIGFREELVQRAGRPLSPIGWAAKRREGCCTVNTCFVVGAVPTCQGYSLFPKLFEYNKGHNDSINEASKNKLKETE